MYDQTLIIEKTKELLHTNSCPELKEAAQQWLDACGSEGEAAAAENYKAVLEDSLCTIDQVIGLFEQPFMQEKVGMGAAQAIRDHAIEVKENGGYWCDCPACTKAQEILMAMGE